VNYESARALGLHLCGRYVRTEVVAAGTVWHMDRRQAAVSEGVWAVRALHAAGFWVVYTQP
jgi:hypothetical protein